MNLYVAPREHLGWLAEKANVVIGPTFQAIEAVDASGRIVAMVGADAWTENACALHVAAEYPAAIRHLLKPTFEMVFNGLKKRMVVATILSDNQKSLALAKHLGFRETHRIKNWWADGVDAVLLEMHRKDCRWVTPVLRKVG